MNSSTISSKYIIMKTVLNSLKPAENILLDKTGHFKITDCGSTIVSSLSSPRWTLCGTPEYHAPEVILGVGYGNGVDW
jgi:serine/threonine protein kinase